jgi:hypothetical protein
MFVYLGADRPLPLLAWDEASPAFHVSELGANEVGVRAQFSFQHVYYAGSHECCGCGFQLGEVSELNAAEIPAKRESLRRLAEYIEAQLASGARVQFFACWSGDEASTPEHRGVVTLADLRGDKFAFLEKELSSFAIE